MAPTLFSLRPRQDGDPINTSSVIDSFVIPDAITNTTTTITGGREDNPAHVWLIVCVILGAIIIAGFAVFVVLDLARRRQYANARRGEAHLGLTKRLSRPDVGRRRKLSEEARWAEDEALRSDIIRKSLASRGTTTAGTTTANAASSVRNSSTENIVQPSPSKAATSMAMHGGDKSQDHLSPNDNQALRGTRSRPDSLKDDRKAWEARLARERSNSGERHPIAAASSTQQHHHHRRFESSDLSVPPRHSPPSSPGRIPLLLGRSPPPSPAFPRTPDAAGVGRSSPATAVEEPAGLEPVHLNY